MIKQQLLKCYGKHFCPQCESRLKLVTPSPAEAVLSGIVVLVPATFVWLILLGVAEKLGLNYLFAKLAAGLVTFLLLMPVHFAWSSFRCARCERTFSSKDVVSRGVFFLP